MKTLMLFSDGSYSSQTNIGYGAYLLVDEEASLMHSSKSHVKLKRFENTSSTRLELQTLIWAFEEIPLTAKKIVVYTDSQNIVGLPGRRDRIEQNNFRSKNNRFFNNHDLYREFYRMIDLLNCEFVKVAGHTPSRNKNDIDRHFTLVDRASRKALRKDNS